MDLILNILTFGIKPLYEKHNSFYEILVEFRNKLPRKQNEARKLTEKDVENNIMLRGISKTMTVIDLSTQKISLTESDIDEFYNKLNSFNYDFILFKKYYISIVKNLNRFNPKAENTNFDLAILKELLEEKESKPLRPIPILIFHLKYKYKLTSWIFKLKK
ncbi:hypothetical protein [uncultured Mesonia sp.]|uniref:hypothetical protein n=1 Tax=uncultured Mesonia sp. TaxID=399731 RepID=UPI00374FBE2A